MINCAVKNAQKFSSFHFVFHSNTIFSDTAILQKPLTPHSMKILVEFFPSSDYLSTCKKINVIQSFHQEICDQRILQSNWLKAFLALTEEQEISPDIGLTTYNNIK